MTVFDPSMNANDCEGYLLTLSPAADSRLYCCENKGVTDTLTTQRLFVIFTELSNFRWEPFVKNHLLFFLARILVFRIANNFIGSLATSGSISVHFRLLGVDQSNSKKTDEIHSKSSFKIKLAFFIKIFIRFLE